MDNVFIAKASEKIDDQKPADMDLSLLSNKARTCDDEGTCYFFIVAQNISNITSKKWTGAKGIEKIEQYNISLLDIAQSAVWHQKQFKGYSAQPNATALLQSLQAKETKPDLSYFINLPVVDYDKAKNTGSKKDSSEKTFLTGLTKEISSIRGWPYAKSTKSSK